jgi:Flp pilus assembly protein TadG
LIQARRSRLAGEGGQALVEFALVLPLLLAVVTGVIQFGIVFRDYLNLTDAVRSGGRVAAISRTAPNPTLAAQTAVTSAGGGLKIAPSDVTVTSTWQPGSDVVVTAAYPYTLSIFGIPVRSGSLTSTTTQRVE